MMKRGALIILEGCDRAGKTSQIAKLTEILSKNGHNTKVLRFPDRSTSIGSTINSYLCEKSDLSDRSIHLLFSANRWEFVNEILRDLNNGITLLVDRYAFSGVAFSAAKGLSLKWCMCCDVGLPKPDAVLFLDLSPDKAKDRGGFGDERYEKLEFQNKVYATYTKLMDNSWTKFDASQPFDVVTNELLHKCESVIAESKTKDVSQLWIEHFESKENAFI